MKKIVSVIGDRTVEPNSLEQKVAFEVGKALIDNGYRVMAGGMGGVMEEVYKGAKASSKYCEGDTIAILPSFDKNEQDGLADIVLPTGLDIMRSGVIGDADFVVMIGGGVGTLSEACAAWALFRPIAAFTNVGGWSAKIAGAMMDQHKRYDFKDIVWPVKTADELIKIINEKADSYDKYHQGIHKAKQNG